MRPRWQKVFSDLWSHRVRLLLVVASIAVGLFAIGMIANIHAILSNDMRQGYRNTNPANLHISLSTFDDDLVEQVSNAIGVGDVEAAREFNGRYRTPEGEWKRISLKALPDFAESKINKVELVAGVWDPQDRQIVLDHTKLKEMGMGLGDTLTLELASGELRDLTVVGIVHDQTIGANSFGGGFFVAPAQGYITTGSLEWLEQPDVYNSLFVTAADGGMDEATLPALAETVRDEIESSGHIIYSLLSRVSDDHPNITYADAMSGILYMLGFFVVFLSSFLITNTLSALLNQQVQQIGTMKTIGASNRAIVQIYLTLIVLYGALAFVIALPLSAQASFTLARFFSAAINSDVLSLRVSPVAVVLQAVLAVVVPIAAGFVPVLRGARITIQEAVSGLTQPEAPRKGWIVRQLEKNRGISRPLLISLRNTFRRRGRLALTLLTLTLGGALFIATFNVEAYIIAYIGRISKYFLADINLTLETPMRISRVQSALADYPEPLVVEGWSAAGAELVFPDGRAGEAVSILAPPGNSKLVDPVVLEGRWIRADDTNAIALNERFISVFPDLKIGDTLRLKVNGEEEDWVVVGFFQLAGKSGGYLAYANYDYLSGMIGQRNKAAAYRVVAQRGHSLTLEEQKQLSLEVEAFLRERGFDISESTPGLTLVETTTNGLKVLTTFLLIMALLTALVGSIGLMGTMSLNVMERTREIGVLRAIGASDGAVISLVLVEGMIIGGISWLLGSLAGLPISQLMSDTISLALFDVPATPTYTPTGFLIWLGMVLLLSVTASVVPAYNAARLTIREVLAYE
jgi:putative ABC transport system permease protein